MYMGVFLVQINTLEIGFFLKQALPIYLKIYYPSKLILSPKKYKQIHIKFKLFYYAHNT